VLHDANQQPLQINYAILRAFALNVEEVMTNPGIQSDNEDDDKGNSDKRKIGAYPTGLKGKSERVPKKKNHGG
jgi:hypothetical protein